MHTSSEEVEPIVNATARKKILRKRINLKAGNIFIFVISYLYELQKT